MTASSKFSSVYDVLLAAASSRPDKIALICDSEEISYSKLLQYIDHAVTCLRGLGISAGDRFALYGQNHPEHLFAYYAAARLGAVFVPVNPHLTTEEVGYTFQHSEAKVLFYDDHVAEQAKQAVPAEKLLPLDRLRLAVEAGEPEQHRAQPADDFLITYSSGTTGEPKAVVLDHQAQVSVAGSLSRMWGISESDRTLVALPLGYLFGLSTAAATGLSVGGTVVILRRFHPRDVLEAMIEHRITVYHGVPTMYSMMMAYCEERALAFDLSKVRLLICSGAPLPNEVAQRFVGRFGRQLQNYYALTEVTPVFGHYHDDEIEAPDGAIGRAAPGTVVRIMGADGTECGVDEPGEIFVRGAATLKRYEKNQSLTSEALQSGLFRTGDLGAWDANGYFYILGRIKDVIIKGGHNISPIEVERVAIGHPGVQDAAVVGVPDSLYGETPVAFIVLRPGASLTQEELVSYLEKKLSEFKIPRSIIFVDSMPQGKTGKVDKARLKDQAIRATA